MLVMAHGWGMEAALWHGVNAALGASALCLDFGYFGSRRLDLPARFVGVGHSLGGLWLLSQAAERLEALVLIGGFARFTAAPGWPGTPPRLLTRMRTAFATEPQATLDAFRGRCSLATTPAARDDAALAEGLLWLDAWDARAALSALRVPVLCLAATDDPIVPPDLAIATAALAGIGVDWAPSGGHILPLTAPAWCAERIAAFLA